MVAGPGPLVTPDEDQLESHIDQCAADFNGAIEESSDEAELLALVWAMLWADL